jgi:hypothetical protein
MNKFLTFFGCKHSPFDQPDGALDPRLTDGEIGGDDIGGESGDEGPERPSHGHRQQPNVGFGQASCCAPPRSCHPSRAADGLTGDLGVWSVQVSGVSEVSGVSGCPGCPML